MKTVTAAIFMICAGVSLTGCGRYYYQNEAFSSAIDTTTQQAPSVATVTAAPERPVATASRRMDSDPAPRRGTASSRPSKTVRTAEAAPRPAARPRSDEIGKADPADIPAAGKVATGDEILAGLLRSWNKMVGPNASSKVLFDLWPEQLDGVPPDLVAIEKRRARTVFASSDLVN